MFTLQLASPSRAVAFLLSLTACLICAMACPAGQTGGGCMITNPFTKRCSQNWPCIPISTKGISAGGVTLNEALKNPETVCGSSSSLRKFIENSYKAVLNAPGQAITFVRDGVVDTLEIDVTQCETEKMKTECEDGEWTCAYGKREWAGKKGAQLAALFFPPPASAAAAESLYRDLQEQYEGAVIILDELIQQAGDEAASTVEDLLKDMIDQLIQNLLKGDVRVDIAKIKPNFGLKINIKYVDCKNQIGDSRVPSEGYFQLVFGYRIRIGDVGPPITAPTASSSPLLDGSDFIVPPPRPPPAVSNPDLASTSVPSITSADPKRYKTNLGSTLTLTYDPDSSGTYYLVFKYESDYGRCGKGFGEILGRDEYTEGPQEITIYSRQLEQPLNGVWSANLEEMTWFDVPVCDQKRTVVWNLQ
ncbi:hypothetical protein Ndes2526A_g04792 [Nannochloris sp. 'desiccata']